MIVSSCNDVRPPQAGHSCQSLTIVRSAESMLLFDIRRPQVLHGVVSCSPLPGSGAAVANSGMTHAPYPAECSACRDCDTAHESRVVCWRPRRKGPPQHTPCGGSNVEAERWRADLAVSGERRNLVKSAADLHKRSDGIVGPSRTQSVSVGNPADRLRTAGTGVMCIELIGMTARGSQA